MASSVKIQTASYILAAIGLFAVIKLGLVSALLAGLLIFHLVEFGAAGLGRIGILPALGRIVLLIIIAIVIVVAISFGIVGLLSSLTAGPESFSAVLHKMADVVGTTRGHLPAWVQGYLPSNVEEWQAAAAEWLRDNARHLNAVGRDIGVFLAHLLIGMIIGGLVALKPARLSARPRPLADALEDRVAKVAYAFRRIVFSQFRISALNTLLTGIFLIVVMPWISNSLPLTKTLIVVTFVAGLLPIVGNLISNTVITLVALSISPLDAFLALGFLIFIHKLEYFVNARIIGTHIRAHAWELLLAMLVMESAFGVPGLVAAPIYYAYIKDELSAKGLI